jgi:GcrA cell cycle regulator
MPDPGWTPERVETLKSLWRDGLSASQVAKALGGVTRNAVIGKIHRLGLSGRAAGGVIRRPAAPRPPRQLRPRSPTPSRLAAANPVMLPVEAPEGPGLASCLEQLGAHACRWPIGDPKAETFSLCGRAAESGPYCVRHDRMAHQPKALKPLTADPIVRRVLAGLAA